MASAFAFGRASSRSAAAPATTADDMLVPDSSSVASLPAPVTSSGCSFAITVPGASRLRIRFPGASRSGLIKWSNRVSPRELYVAITSSDRNAVPFVFTAPAVIA